MQPDERAYAKCWNAGRFFDAHETLEERWARTRDRALHGLIQLAAALHHLQKGNVPGARTMLDRTLARFDSCDATPSAIDIPAMARYARRLKEALASRQAGWMRIELTALIDGRPLLPDSTGSARGRKTAHAEE